MTSTPRSSVYRSAAATAAILLKDVFNVRVGKATLNPLDPDDFDVIVSRLASALRTAVGGYERTALRSALAEMDIDWANTTEADHRAVFQAVAQAVESPRYVVLPRVDRAFRIRGDVISGRTRRNVLATMDASVQASFSLRDARVAEWLRTSQSAFVTDEYGRRAARASELARQIVADGLDEGLGSRVIAADLRERVGDVLTGRSRSYWDVVASAFAGRARSFGTLSALNDAGIEIWEFIAMMDEVTCDTCRFFNGMRFSVGGSYERFVTTSQLTEPDDIRDAMPWVRHGRDHEGNRTLYIQRSNGMRETIATVMRSGVGSWDDSGEYRDGASTQRLEALGCNMPPLHGRCRCMMLSSLE